MNTACRFCGCKSFSNRTIFKGTTEKYKNETYTYGRCSDCRSILNMSTDNPGYDNYPTGKTISRAKVRRFAALLNRCRIKKEARILDYGCGEGALFLQLREMGFMNAVGYEPYSKTHNKTLEKDIKYDVVYLTHVFEHIGDYERFFADLNKSTKPGSLLITIHPSSTRIPTLDKDDPFQAYTIHSPFHTIIPSDKAAVDLFNRHGYHLKFLVPYDIQRSGLKDNNRVSALLAHSLGVKENWLGASQKTKLLAALRSPIKFFDGMLIHTRDSYVSTMVFERRDIE
jgi:cyclopropane fatty-acyl-phospholipid synthase-like methyltransferase